jgi:protease-4
MRKALARLLAIVGGLVVFLTAVVLVVALAVRLAARVPGKTILEVNLETALVEDIPDDALARAMLSGTPVVRDIVEALERAAGDRRVVGLVARLGRAPLGMAQVQELRQAVLSFRARKKFAIAFAETFGEFEPSGGSYYLATGFDQILLQPSGDVGLTGILMESPFLRGTLDKLGLKPRLDHRYEYKNAMNTLTEKKYTAAHREAEEKVMLSWFSQLVKGTSQGRRMSEDQVRALIDRGPFLGQEALDAKLVDGLVYKDELRDRVKQEAGSDAEFLSLATYLDRAGRPHRSGRTVALIYGVGSVHRGKSGFDPLDGSPSMGSDTLTAAFRAAIEDRAVKAIIFRIDSPGGSYVASDAIWRETVRARKAGKPVIVTMGDVAGSGGYFVAMAAHRIVAQPGTITGSIGVLAGKVLTSGFWDKLGISWDEVHSGRNATMWTGTADYTPSEWARFQTWLDRVYGDFTSKVAEGRRLPKDRVLQIARGRIWTGEDAKALGLVDELGGFPAALRLAKAAAGVPETEDVNIEVFPHKRGSLELLLERLAQWGLRAEQPDPSTGALVRLLRMIQPVAGQLRSVIEEPGVLSMPPVGVRP